MWFQLPTSSSFLSGVLVAINNYAMFSQENRSTHRGQHHIDDPIPHSIRWRTIRRSIHTSIQTSKLSPQNGLSKKSRRHYPGSQGNDSEHKKDMVPQFWMIKKTFFLLKQLVVFGEDRSWLQGFLDYHGITILCDTNNHHCCAGTLKSSWMLSHLTRKPTNLPVNQQNYEAQEQSSTWNHITDCKPPQKKFCFLGPHQPENNDTQRGPSTC